MTKLVILMNMCLKCVSSVTDVVGNRPMPTLVDQKALLKVIYHTYVGESGERCPGFYYVIYYSKMTMGKQKLGVSTEADIIFLQKYHTFVPEIL